MDDIVWDNYKERFILPRGKCLFFRVRVRDILGLIIYFLSYSNDVIFVQPFFTMNIFFLSLAIMFYLHLVGT